MRPTFRLNRNEEYRPHCTDACRGTICPCWNGHYRACVWLKVPTDPFGDPLPGTPPQSGEYYVPHLCEMSIMGPCR